MTKINFILYFVVLFMALGKVNAEHQYRKLFSENEHQKDIGRQLNLEYSQLQLEQSTLSMQSKIEDTAKKSLKMKEPETKKIIMLEKQ
jgi:cell division protein FtsL